MGNALELAGVVVEVEEQFAVPGALHKVDEVKLQRRCGGCSGTLGHVRALLFDHALVTTAIFTGIDHKGSTGYLVGRSQRLPRGKPSGHLGSVDADFPLVAALSRTPSPVPDHANRQAV